MLATWERLPDAVVIEVDGEPFTSRLHYMPRRARADSETQMPLPGTAQAADLRLALIKEIEKQAGIDRRNPLPVDTFNLGIIYLCTFVIPEERDR